MTKRLRELEAAERTPKDGRDYLDGVTLGVRRATIEGYKMALEDLAPVLAAANGLMRETQRMWPHFQVVNESDHTIAQAMSALRDALEEVSDD